MNAKALAQAAVAALLASAGCSTLHGGSLLRCHLSAACHPSHVFGPREPAGFSAGGGLAGYVSSVNSTLGQPALRILPQLCSSFTYARVESDDAAPIDDSVATGVSDRQQHSQPPPQPADAHAQHERQQRGWAQFNMLTRMLFVWAALLLAASGSDSSLWTHPGFYRSRLPKFTYFEDEPNDWIADAPDGHDGCCQCECMMSDGVAALAGGESTEDPFNAAHGCTSCY